MDQIITVFFKVTSLQEKLRKGSVHINRMKQYFTYDDPPQCNPMGISLKKITNRWNHLQNLVTREKIFPDKILENHIKSLIEASLLSYQN